MSERSKQVRGVWRAAARSAAGIVVAALVSLLPAPFVLAQAWHLAGTNEMIFDRYAVGGNNDAASPYQFEGSFFTNRTDFGLSYEDDLGHLARLSGEIILTDSDYFQRDGAIVGNLSMLIEDGSHRIPYRITLGDFYGDFSRRALQRNLRGASIELQASGAGGVHSFLVSSGTGTADWRDTFKEQGQGLYFTGLSYLYASDSGKTTIVANAIDARQDAGIRGSLPVSSVDREQKIGSLSGDTMIGKVHLEAEVAFLDGDVGDAKIDDTSHYERISRQGKVFAWTVRHEENGKDYLPIGAVGIIANRRSSLADTRLRLGKRSTLRARAERIENQFEGESASHTSDLYNLSFDGSLAPSRPSLHLNASAARTELDASDGSVDRRFDDYAIEIRDRIGRNWSIKAGARRRETDDHLNAAASRRTTDYTGSLGRAFRGASWEARVEGGYVYREQRLGGNYDSRSPMLDLTLRAGRQTLAAHLARMKQEFVSPTTGDLEYQTSRITWSLTAGAHKFSLELGRELRRVESNLRTDSRRITFRYRYRFDRDV